MRKLILAGLLISTSLLADGEAKVLAGKYTELGLEQLEQVRNFKYVGKFRNVDEQSKIVRDSSGKSYLLIFDREVPRRVAVVDLKRGRDLKAGSTAVQLCAMKGRRYSAFDSACGGETWYPVVNQIFALENMTQENSVLKALRESDL